MSQKESNTSKSRTRNYATVVYPESAPENWQQIISESKIPVFISPLHDQDINPTGEHKKSHFHVMAMYENFFGRYHCKVAQVLLTKSVMTDKEKAESITRSFEEMFNYGVLPIVNENDVIASDNKNSGDMFGDNDTLSASVAALIKADVLVIWSDIDGLYTKNPRSNPDAEFIPVVHGVTEEIYKMAGGAGSKVGTGGMLTKLNAAVIANNAGVDMIIANSSKPELLYDLAEGKPVGTLFKA